MHLTGKCPMNAYINVYVHNYGLHQLYLASCQECRQLRHQLDSGV